MGKKEKKLDEYKEHSKEDKIENSSKEEVKNVDSKKEKPEKKKEAPKKELTAEEKIKKLEGDVLEQKDITLRLQAEYQNYRKRSFKDVQASRMAGQLDVIDPILTVLEHFNMAVKAAETGDNMAAIQQGLTMIGNEFNNAMTELDVEAFDAVGKKFDPNIHEAMDKQSSDEIEEGFVISQWTRGYKLGDKILRPVKVVVSSGVEKEEVVVEVEETESKEEEK